MASKDFVKNRIAAAFAANELESDVVQDIAFHITDWKDNLDQVTPPVLVVAVTVAPFVYHPAEIHFKRTGR